MRSTANINLTMFLMKLFMVGLLFPSCAAFTVNAPSSSSNVATNKYFSPLFMSTSTPKKGYVPKWTKKKTLAEEMAESGGPRDLAEVGLKGDIPVVFKQGNQTKSTVALAGQPLRDVATNAGQFIKYGCGKGECGTCECLVNGQWVRPCTSVVPPLSKGQEYVVQVKEVKSKTTSSGKFYSLRSFLMGFWNNLLGMVGFYKYRTNAKKNWDERQEYEDLIRQKTMAKKAARLAQYQHLKP